MPASERLSGPSSVTSAPSKVMEPLGDLVGGVAHDDVAERGLAGAVGAHEHVGLARADGQADAVEDGLVLGSGREPGDGKKLV